jgi:hypothetical protein
LLGAFFPLDEKRSILSPVWHSLLTPSPRFSHHQYLSLPDLWPCEFYNTRSELLIIQIFSWGQSSMISFSSAQVHVQPPSMFLLPSTVKHPEMVFHTHFLCSTLTFFNSHHVPWAVSKWDIEFDCSQSRELSLIVPQINKGPKKEADAK